MYSPLLPLALLLLPSAIGAMRSYAGLHDNFILAGFLYSSSVLDLRIDNVFYDVIEQPNNLVVGECYHNIAGTYASSYSSLRYHKENHRIGVSNSKRPMFGTLRSAGC